jgi:F-type H+-transporting ATPase subunit b
VLLEMSTHWL